MDLASGVFTVPKNGTYVFSFNAVVGVNETSVYLESNGAVEASASANNNENLSLTTALILKRGERIRLRLSRVANPGSIKEFDRGNYKLTHFIGFILKELPRSTTLFFVRSRNWNKWPTTFTFDEEVINLGGAMNKTTGVFTVPKAGRYFFKFSAPSQNPNGEFVEIVLMLNGAKMDSYSLDRQTFVPHTPALWNTTKSFDMSDEISVKLIYLQHERASHSMLPIIRNFNCEFTGLSLDDKVDVSVKSLQHYRSPPFNVSIAFWLSHEASFLVSRSSSFSPDYRMTIPFQVALKNSGNVMNLTAGIFTAPKTGVYYFSFHSQADSSNTIIHLKLNNLINICSAFGPNRLSILTLQSTIALQKGDQISVFLDEDSIYEDLNHKTHFIGVLLS